MKIKVCGMTNFSEHERLFDCSEIDFFGSIQFPPSPRYFPKKLNSSKPTIGVFVNETVDTICSKIEAFELSGVQLHGNETVEFIQQLPLDVLVFKAFSISSKEDFETIHAFDEQVDYFLFDTPSPQHGGSGQQFDWKLLEHYRGETPFFLSGGIGPNDVKAVKNFQHPSWVGIDINSRFETAPGQKNSTAILTFLNALNS